MPRCKHRCSGISPQVISGTVPVHPAAGVFCPASTRPGCPVLSAARPVEALLPPECRSLSLCTLPGVYTAERRSGMVYHPPYEEHRLVYDSLCSEGLPFSSLRSPRVAKFVELDSDYSRTVVAISPSSSISLRFPE